MRDMEEYKKDMLKKYPAYRLDCVVMETVEDILKDLPEFAAYFAVCHKQAEYEWKANYKRGQELAQQEKELLARCDGLIPEKFLICTPRKEALGEARWEFVKQYEDHIQSFFLLHLAAMSSKVEADNHFARFFGIQDGNPSSEFLDFAETYIVPAREQACRWSPHLFPDLF